MKKIILLLIIYHLSLTITNAQSLAWAISEGGTNYDYGYSIAVDASGNVYTVGAFKGTVDFNPSPTLTTNLSASGTNADIFVQKLDANGNLLWVKKIGGAEEDRARAISADNFGNIYITGTFRGTVDFDPGIGTTNLVNPSTVNDNGFVLKLTDAGVFRWARFLQSSSSNIPEIIAADNASSVVLTGRFSGNADFDPGAAVYTLSSSSGQQNYYLKLDSTGTFVWANPLASTRINSMLVDNAGNIHSVGSFGNTVDFDPGSGVANLTGTQTAMIDPFYLKWDTNGNFISVMNIAGGTSTLEFTGLDLDASGNSFICGYFDGTVDFNPGAGVHNITSFGANGFVLKLDAANNYLLSAQVGDYSNVYARDVFADATGAITVVGEYLGPVDWDVSAAGVANLYSSGTGNDIFILKLSSTGTYVKVKKIGGANIEDLYETVTDASNNIYLAGNYVATADFDPDTTVLNFTPNGSYDAFFVKLNSCAATANSITQTDCGSYTLNSQTYTSSGNYTQHLTNSGGCDSVLTINLTINTVDDSIIVGGASFYANSPTGTYQWLDCNNGNSIITGETGQYYTPGANGYFSVVITDNGCVDTSNCAWLLTIGEEELGIMNYELEIFPNPAASNLTIRQYANVPIQQIMIHNVLGTCVLQSEIQNPKSEISVDVSALPNGVYFVEAASSDSSKGGGTTQIKRTKFIKQ